MGFPKTENDYSVCTTWAECDDGYYLVDLWKDKLEFPMSTINVESRKRV